MRRLADLAFLFQLYDFSYQTYHTAKRDFNNDHAWLHYAGALVRTLTKHLQRPCLAALCKRIGKNINKTLTMTTLGYIMLVHW